MDDYAGYDQSDVVTDHPTPPYPPRPAVAQ